MGLAAASYANAVAWYVATSAPHLEGTKESVPVKFMLTWRTRPGLYKAAFQQFLETGGPPPKGVEQVARYHVPGSVLGWHVLETNDMTALAEHVNNWGDLIDIELNPIVEDTQAAEAAARVFGK